MPGLEVVRAGGGAVDGERPIEVRDRIIWIVDRVPPILHVGMHAALHGKHFPPFDQSHDIGGPALMQRRPMEDNIDACFIVRIPLNIV